MNKYGEKLNKTAIRFVRNLPGPIERVWAYIAEAEKRALWLAGGETSAEIGGDAIFEFDHSKITPHDEDVPDKYKTPDGSLEFDVRFVSKVLAHDPPHHLKVTWCESNEPDSILSFTLTEKGDRVELVLLHEKVPSKDYMLGILGGWHAHLDILENRINDKKPGPFWANHETLETEYKQKYF